MPDERIKQFTEWYHEKYLEVKGVKYAWKGGKEQKLMQTCLKYFDGSDGDSLQKMKDSCQIFLDSEDKFIIERGHNLSDFLTDPNKWAYKLLRANENKRRAENNQRIFRDSGKAAEDSIKIYRQQRTKPTTGDSWIDDMAENPEQWFKGFKLMVPLYKAGNPKLFEKLRSKVIEFYGKEKIKELWGKSPDSPFNS